MVGAGSVAVLLTRALETNKHNEVTYYVREGRKAKLPRVKLLEARTGALYVRERPAVVEPKSTLPKVDTVILPVRGDQLDEALDVVARLGDGVRIASASAGIDDVARIRARFPGRAVVQILPAVMAYPEADTTKWWIPPFAKTVVSYESDDAAKELAEDLVKDFTAGGVPSRVVRAVGAARDAFVGAGMPLLASLELAGWDFGAWSRSGELRGLASSGMREGLRAVLGKPAARFVGLAPAPLLSVMLRAFPSLAPKGVLDMWRVHGPKIAGQTRAMLDTIIARGADRAAATDHLRELRRRLDAAQ